MNLKLILILLLFAAFNAVQNSKKSDPNCHKDIFANCLNRLLMFGDKTFTFPTTMEQMNKRCKEVKPLQQCMKEYIVRCLTGDTKNALSVVVYSFGKTNKIYCSSTARKQSFVAFGGCANAHHKKMIKLMDDLNLDMHGVKLYKDAKLKIPLLCCNYSKFTSKFSKLLNSGKCTDSEVQEIENVLEGYSRDGLNLVCGDYTDESDKCTQIIGLTPKWTKPLTHSSFVIPTVDIMQGL